MPLGSEVTLGSTLENLTGYEAPVVEVPVVDLAVESVTALNFREIEVVFNTELDEDTVLEADFTVEGVAAKSVTLSEDMMTVLVEVADAKVSATAPAEYDVVITTDVKSVDGLALAADYKVTLEHFDTTRPTVVSVELTGPKTFDITFSEPLKVATVPTVKVNNGVYGASVAAPVSKVVTVTLSATTLPEADYTITISGYEDEASLSGLSTNMTLTYAKVTTAPTATIKAASETEVTVKFDRAVKLAGADDTLYFYHTYTAWAPATATPTSPVNGFATEWVLTFPDAAGEYPIPAGDFKLVVLKSDGTDTIVDEWGNEMAANAELMGTVVADVTAPTVTEVKFVDEATIKVYFSEDVVTAEAQDDASYTITAVADGTVVDDADFAAVYTANADEWFVTITFTPQLDGGEYTIAVADIHDDNIANNTLVASTNSFTVVDATPIADTTPEVTVILGATDADDEVLYVSYPEAMNDTAITASYYLIDLGAGPVALDDDAELAFFDGANKVVKITIPHLATLADDGSDDLIIGKVQDAAGNAFDGGFAMSAEAIGSEDGAQVTAVKQTADNKLTIEFDKALKSILADAFTVLADGNTRIIAGVDSWENKDLDDDGVDEAVAYVTLQADSVTDLVADDAAYSTDSSKTVAVGTLALVGEHVVSFADKASDNVADLSGSVVDYRAPEFASIASNDAGGAGADTITVTFSEAIKSTTVAANTAGADFVVKNAAGTVLKNDIDFVVTIVGTDVIFTFVADIADFTDYTVTSAAAPQYVVDNTAQDNVMATFTAKDAE
jgi:hypothetical protein